jgi:Tol biopolymer transport system component
VQRVSPRRRGIFYQASIHPAGTHVVFFGNTAGPPRVWKTDLVRGAVSPLTPADSGARHPVYSWDGAWIAFASDRATGQAPERIEQMRGDGQPPADHVLHLFVMDGDGGQVRQITSGPYQDQRPSFSPDGRTLVFVSNRGGGMQLWSVPVDGSAAPRALQSRGWGYRPWVSADGRSIFFFTDVGGRHQICRMPIEGGEPGPLRNDDRGSSHGPFADPSGTCLLMHSTRDFGRMHLWQLPLDGSPPILLQPPGFTGGAHATRSKNGIVAFDGTPDPRGVRAVVRRLLGRTHERSKR